MSKEWPLWEVFIRGQHGLNHRHVGSLHAPDAEMAMLNARVLEPQALVSLARIPEMQGISALPDGGIRIGAFTRHAGTA